MKMKMKMDRYWINQPSTLDYCHDMHGRLVIAPEVLTPEYDQKITVYFADGPVTSAVIPVAALSRGWPAHLVARSRGEVVKYLGQKIQ